MKRLCILLIFALSNYLAIASCLPANFNKKTNEDPTYLEKLLKEFNSINEKYYNGDLELKTLKVNTDKSKVANYSVTIISSIKSKTHNSSAVGYTVKYKSLTLSEANSKARDGFISLLENKTEFYKLFETLSQSITP